MEIDHEQVMNRRSKKLFGEDDVVTKFGVKPAQLCDLRAMTGDKAVLFWAL
jgi:5'-3' exonuclease